ncbi:MAG TPA: NYN domain-containing protein [Streptosporangiaceae bacterium]
MDRCALFVDAGYVLADGAMAVHGTRHRESVSWDYAGLLQFMGSIARERTGRPLLRCYWYEASVEGRRTSEHDALADLPGLKLRLGRTRPGRREGVESEIRRDLTTLARNNAISDALLVSAEEDLAQVVADVQDLGLRVTIVHITVGGNWTISRSLRQECDDIIEIGEGHLRPFTQLVAGTDSLGGEEPYQLAVSAARALTNGHGPVAGPLGQQALSAGSHPAPPAIYTAPVVAEYQRAAQPGAQPASAHLPNTQLPDTQLPDTQLPNTQAPGGQPAPLPRREPSGPIERQSMEATRGGPSRAPGSTPGVPPQSAQNLQASSGLQAQPGVSEPQRGPGPGQRQPGGPAQPGQQSMPGQPIAPQSYGQPSLPPQGMPVPGLPAQQNGSGQQHAPGQSMPGQSMGGQSMGGQPSMPGLHAAPPGPPSPSSPGLPDPRVRGAHAQSSPGEQNPYQSPPASFRGPAQDVPSRQYQPGPYGVLPPEQMMPGQPYPPPAPPPGGSGQNPGPSYMPPQSPYGTPQSPLPPMPQNPLQHNPMQQTPGQQHPGQPQAPVPPPVPPAPGPQAGGQPGQGIPLADAVQAAHAEGFEFGQSVAREAPALWLEAVLARKPRMPSDLEARLLQDSALPIDSLLHDETRHALRRGFWDALERSRR